MLELNFLYYSWTSLNYQRINHLYIPLNWDYIKSFITVIDKYFSLSNAKN